jgi:phenylpropionate dioxygenase-like ring-hydroxylating dioxygenase large terminal subunit
MEAMENQLKAGESTMSRQRIGEVAETLLEYFEHQKTFQSDKMMTVPAQTYTDRDQWQSEVDLIFKRLPLMLALSCEISRPGDYKAMEAVGIPVLIARDKTGGVHAYLNVCAHRWTPVVGDGYGNCTRFTCPLHGWTYSSEGKLIGISDQAKFGDIDRATHGLKPLPCAERQGMIFVCLTPDAPLDLEAYYGSLLEEYAFAGLKDWAFLGSHVLDGANWKLTLSNFFEGYHFSTLHTKTVAPLLVSDVMHYEGFGPNIRIGLAHRPINKLRDLPRENWGDQEGKGSFSFIRFFFPNVTGTVQFELSSNVRGFRTSQVGFSLFTQILPGPSPDESRVVLLYARERPPESDAEREEIEKVMNWTTFDITRDEDVASGLQIQKSLQSRAHEGLLYGRNERGNQYFHEWLNWYLKGDPSASRPSI